MNGLAKKWNQHHQNSNSDDVDSVDSIEIDGEKRTIMAERQRLPGEVIKLSRGHFNNIVRVIARVPFTEIGQIRTLTYENLKRLGVKRDLSKAVSGMPRGTSQIDVGSIGEWMKKITVSDKKAVNQLIALDATCCARG